ncbi:MAG: hypothetical protein JO102_03615 [Elusimicrobia bacterium]|nr:hypothetical protein [Elusimicrobiota bacterium]
MTRQKTSVKNRKRHPDSPAPNAPDTTDAAPAEDAGATNDVDPVAATARWAAQVDAQSAESGTLQRPLGLQKTKEVKAEDVEKEEEDDTFSEGAIGGLDPDDVPGQKNPQGVQTGRGPLNQDDQGNRQNSEAEELEQVEPDIDPFKSPR